jgi:4-hydroxymandelate oxidase
VTLQAPAAPGPAREPVTDWPDWTQLERLARAALPGPVWDFLAGGSGQESTLRANRAALERISLIPRVLRDVSGRTTTGHLVGADTAMPVAIAPVAYHRLVHPDGELASARAAARAGVPITISTLSSTPLEQVVGTGAITWFQLYWLRDRERCLALVDRAEQGGCAALMLTVDVPWMGRRLRDVRNGFALPDHVQAVHLASETAGGHYPAGPSGSTAAHESVLGRSAVATHTDLTFAPALTWADLDEIRSRTRLPLIVKGLLDADDARRAVDAGADAVVVSNHGGRQLDGALPSIEALPAIRSAIGGQAQVLLDSGIRDGIDVLRALALGADGVLIGRPLLWGLAVGGEAGAYRVLELLAAELYDGLGLAGCTDVREAQNLKTFLLHASSPSPDPDEEIP